MAKYSLLQYLKAPKIRIELARQGGTFSHFLTSIIAKHQKLKGPIGEKITQKSLTMPEKLKGGTLCDFSTYILSQNIKKLKGGPFGESLFRKKVSQCQKTERGDSLVSPGIVCYAEKEEKLFLFNSLCQMIQFGTI